MRGELLKFADGSAIINDSYNSSPAALHAMIAVLAATPDYKRRILAAGEMRELGTTSPELHREAGAFAAQTGKIDWVIGVAGDGAQIVEGAVAAGGVPRAQTKVFASSDEAAGFLREFLQSGDLMLVKGSRGVKMERVVEAVAARHGDAVGGSGVVGGASAHGAERVRH
jgi:UDP-N-acetylmuramoyl-tripeptide--D-alanyl-D-alanine ligase